MVRNTGGVRITNETSWKAQKPVNIRGVPIPRLLCNTDLNYLNMQLTYNITIFHGCKQSIAYMTPHTRTQQLLIRYASLFVNNYEHSTLANAAFMSIGILT